MSKNKKTQAKEATAKAASDKNAQEGANATNPEDNSGTITEVVEQTLEEFEKDVAEIKTSEELDAIEASEKEGKARTGAFEIIEKRRNELQEEAEKAKNTPDVKVVKKKTKKVKPGKKKVKILASNMAGKYLLSFGKGDEVELEEKQADEMIEAGDAKEL